MKIALTITIDDTEKVYESVANLQSSDGVVDRLTMKWITTGMLFDALQGLRVVEGQGGAPDGVEGGKQAGPGEAKQ